MVALSRCLGSLWVLLAGTGGARISRNRRSAPSTKFIANVPVLNYPQAHVGKASLGERVSDEEQEWILMVNPRTTDDELKRMCASNRNGCNLAGHPSKGGVPFVELRATEKDLESVIKLSDGAVRYVELDSEVSMIPEIEADVEAATWGLDRIGADQRSGTGAGATVFVLDTGVRTTHQEFRVGRAASALDMSSGGVECNGDVNCAKDNQGHGTHCAGTVAGETVGVAPEALIRSVKVLGDDGSGSWSWSINALDWIASSQTRPAIASMSLGGPGTQQSMADAVDAAVNAGVAVVVAAGNSNSDACQFSPAFVPSAITVGSTDSNDRRSSFSNYGSCVDIWAPGSSVRSASHTSDTGYVSFSGTSMACPHVAGGAAIVLEANPSMNPSEVLAELLGNAVRNAISDLKSGDTNALLYVGEGTPPSPSPTPPPTGGSCVQETDCSVSIWCNNDFTAWCRANAATCPAPYCKRM